MKHPGFKSVQSKIAHSQGVSMQSAGAILASSSRNASPAAKRANPRLNRVEGSSADEMAEMHKKACKGNVCKGME